MDPQRARRVHEPFVANAIIVALTVGFGYATVLVAAPLFSIPLGAWWVAVVQAHGHAQLFGWTGLFVTGVGLVFLPRLRGTVLARADLAQSVLAAVVLGVALRSISQPLMAIVSAGPLQDRADLIALGNAAMASSAVAELIGMVILGVMLSVSFRSARPLTSGSPIVPVRPYLGVAGLSFAAAVVFNLALSLQAAVTSSFLFDPPLDQVLTQLMVKGFVVPIAFALAIRNLPLFMRLAFPVTRRLGLVFAMYVVGMVTRITAPWTEQVFGTLLGGIGHILEAAAVLFFIWDIDILFRRKKPWTASRVQPPDGYIETRRPTRKGYPDYGEYGRFELLIISAFAWLTVAASIAGVNGFLILMEGPALVSSDAERHAITLGFITLLIFGMAARMLPGFSGKTRVASTALVLATFWLGNAAAFLRVIPLLFPEFPGGGFGYGISGAVGWVAVVCLAINMWRTFRMENRPG